MSKKQFEVVAAVIEKDNKVFCCQRGPKGECAFKWEFPGGKIEPGETKEDALIREIKEEFNAEIKVEKYIGENIHHYPEKDIKLIFLKATLLSKELKLLEHEDYKWITKEDKEKYEFAGADKKVFELI